MAVRIDFFSVEHVVDLERVDLTALVGDGTPPGSAARWEGHVAASGYDEGILVELAGLRASHGVSTASACRGVSEDTAAGRGPRRSGPDRP